MTDAEPLAFSVVERLLKSRHSCRAFLPDPVPRPDVDRILAAAQRTASWCNTQPWHVVVTHGDATTAYRDALRQHIDGGAAAPDLTFPTYEGIYRERRKESGLALYRSLGIGRGDQAAAERQTRRNFVFFDAPHVAIISTPRSLGCYGAIDCGAYVANFLLVAHSLGIAAIPQAALAVHADLVHAHFGIPGDRDIVCGIAFGYEDPAAPVNRFRTGRAGSEEVADHRV